MGKYRYVIKKENDGYCFILYPNNIVYQEVGRSVLFSTFDECKDKLNKFKKYVIENLINNYNSKFINIYMDEKLWYYSYIMNDKVIFYRRSGYGSKENAKKIIKSIYKHIDAELD